MTVLPLFHPKDWIALTVLSGGLVLIGLGIDHIVSGLVITVTAYYFGRRTDDALRYTDVTLLKNLGSYRSAGTQMKKKKK